MSSDYSFTSIGSTCEITTGFPFKSSDYCVKSDSIKLLRGDNIAQGNLRWDGVKRWNPDNLERSAESKYSLKSGDVVIAMDRPWIEAGLKFAAIQDSDLPCLLVQRVARLRAGEKVDQRYLKYVVSDYSFTNHVLAVQTGTAVPHISSKQIAEYEFAAPPLSDQKTIAHILGTLDDKIELNRKTNETLEAMAKALFKSWFVDFDPVRAKAEGRQTGLPDEISDLFPDSFEDSELGEIPSGWEVGEIGHIVKLNKESIDPSDHPEEIFDHYSIPSFDTGKFPAREPGAFIKSQKFLVGENDLLVSKLNPSTPRIWIPFTATSGRSICSTEFLVCQVTVSTGRAFAYCLAFSDAVIEAMTGLAGGTSNSHQRIRPGDFLSLASCLGSIAIREAFNAIVEPLLRQTLLSRNESRSLAATRDALLPKLISGEIRIPDAERLLEDVGI